MGDHINEKLMTSLRVMVTLPEFSALVSLDLVSLTFTPDFSPDAGVETGAVRNACHGSGAYPIRPFIRGP
jgi:hypothetical protein